ncbi:MAG: CcmD family protein [Spirochaetes bacterium]|nr:CcmD family protein [Spirochaetota bacterium]
MRNKFILTILLSFLFSTFIYAQENISVSQSDNRIYVVMLIALLTWIAVSVYIYSLNRKVKSLEKTLRDE